MLKIFIIFFLILRCLSFAQKKEEIILNDKIYALKANYFTASEGVSYNFKNKSYEYATFFSYAFNFNKFHIQLNYLLSSERFIIFKSLQRSNVVGFTIGKNIENQKYFISFCGGPSYNFGYYYFGKSIRGVDLYKSFSETGLLLSFDFIRKFFYDFGIGPSIIYSKSHYSNFISVTLKLFFSGAYKSSI